MKFRKLILAILLVTSSSAVAPVLAQSNLDQLFERRRSERDKEQLYRQQDMIYRNDLAAAEQAEQQKQLILIGVGVLIAGGLGGVWFYNKKFKSPS